MRIILLTCVSIGLISCSSNLVLRSEPEGAMVYARLPSGNDKKQIGKTPLTIPTKDLEKELRISPASGDFVELVFELDGYRTEYMMIPPTRLVTTETVVGVKMRTGPAEGQIAETLLQHVQNAQKFTQNKEFERAMIEIDRALEINNKFVRATTLKASVYFLKGEYDASLTWYERALLLDPKNDDALRMINFIREKKLGQPAKASN
jgi:tetratricopeptide (TPR) repeat protein